MACFGVMKAPVRLETKGSLGGCRRTERTRSVNASRMPSIIEEWKAWEVCRRVVKTSRPRSVSSRASMAGVGPATTHSRGELTAARARGSRMRPSSSEGGRATASMDPGSIDCMRRPALGHEGQSVLEGEDAGQVRGHVLADAVARSCTGA